MKNRRYVLSLLLLSLMWSAGARAAPVTTIPIEKIRPGMKGYGLTVFSGFKVERFNVEVIDVIRNFLPNQDLFLARVDHPELRHTGVIGGMSGSPIYLEGKLAGALAYGWRFAKDPVCGITPIKSMLEVLRRSPRGVSPWNDVLPRRELDQASRSSLARLSRFWRLPSARNEPQGAQVMEPVAVPLNLAGFSQEAAAELKQALAGFGFEPLQGGGTGVAEGPRQFEPGGSLGVQLVSGDMSMSGTGTTTWVDGARVLGFGHRMFNAGEIYLPAVSARVHHSVANLARSFKLASPARTLGTLVQDRQAGIFVDTSRRVETVPVTITTRFQGQKRVFKVSLARHRLLTPTLATSVMVSALGEVLSDVDQATFKVATRLSLRDHGPLYFEDHIFSPGGVGMAAALFSRGVRAVREVMSNDFEPVFIERLDLDLDVKFANEVVEIVAIGLSSTTVEPGSRVNLQVTFRPFAGPDFTKTYPLDIPKGVGGSLLQVEVASGAQTQPDRAPPENMKQYLEALQDSYPARALVVSLSTPYEGLKLRGSIIRDLPGSVLDALNTASQVRGEQPYQTVLRHVHGTSRVITGKKSIRIRVRSEVNP